MSCVIMFVEFFSVVWFSSSYLDGNNLYFSEELKKKHPELSAQRRVIRVYKN